MLHSLLNQLKSKIKTNSLTNVQLEPKSEKERKSHLEGNTSRLLFFLLVLFDKLICPFFSGLGQIEIFLFCFALTPEQSLTFLQDRKLAS